MITMMLLLLAGVEHDDIVDDYELSVRDVNEYFKASPHPKESPRAEPELTDALEQWTTAMRRLMAGFDVERYLLDAGLTAAELQAIRARLFV